MSPLGAVLADLADPALETRLHADAGLKAASAELEAALTALLNDLHAPAEARWRAAFLLGDLGCQTAIPALVAGLADANWSVRHACACALGTLGNPAALPALLALATAQQPDEQTNYVAAIGLLRLHRGQGEAVLRAVAAGGNRAGRNTALSALASLAY